MYIWIGGGTPSLIRAGLMLFFCGLLLFLKKPVVLLDGLLLAVLIILLAHPQTMFDIRLQLSALAMAAIALISPVLSWFAAWFRVQFNNRFMPQANGKYGKAHKCAHYLLEGMVMLTCTSLAVQIALMPVLSNAFVGVGVAFPLNLLWLPILGMLVMPAAFLGLLATALNLSWFAQLCFQIAAYPCAWLMDFLRWLQGLELLPVIFPVRPHWLFILGVWFILSILPLFCMRLANRASLRLPGVLIALGLLLCLLPTGLRAYEQSRDAVRLRLIDVGQGQAILLEYPGGKRLLLDGGGVNNGRLSSSSFDIGKDVITATLLDNRPAHLDYMLASHPDYDHIQGLIHPLTHLQVDYFADNGAPYSNDLSHARLLDILQRKQYAQNSLYAGQTLTLNSASGSDYGELRLEVLHPQNTTAYTDKSNNQSLVVRLVWRGKPLALLCGDAENKAQREILKHYAAQDLKAQVLVLPHHGSKGASLKAFYKAVAPELALASCAYGNRWFFPAEKTRQNLNDLGIKLMSTSEYGQIIIEWEGEDAKMSVTAARE
jgi:competence protein ComEC